MIITDQRRHVRKIAVQSQKLCFFDARISTNQDFYFRICAKTYKNLRDSNKSRARVRGRVQQCSSSLISSDSLRMTVPSYNLYRRQSLLRPTTSLSIPFFIGPKSLGLHPTHSVWQDSQKPPFRPLGQGINYPLPKLS